MTGWTWARAAVIGAVAFVVGFVVGGVGPRGEVRDLERENFELQKKAAKGGVGGTELARLLQGRLGPEGGAGDPRRGGLPEPVRDAPPGDTDPTPEQEALAREAFADDLGGADAPPRSREEAEAAVRDLVAARAAQARAALMEDADPSPEQVARIDAALAEMNDTLEGIARDFVDRAKGSGELGRRELMGTAADLLDVLVATEDKVLGALEPDQRDRLREEASDPTAFVEPRVVELLSELGELAP